MKNKICNQVMMKNTELPDNNIRQQHAGTKCLACSEFTTLKMPMPIEQMSKWLEMFVKLHTIKGCNKTKVTPK